MCFFNETQLDSLGGGRKYTRSALIMTAYVTIDASLNYSILCIFVGGIAQEGGRSHFVKQRKEITSNLLWYVMDGLL